MRRVHELVRNVVGIGRFLASNLIVQRVCAGITSIRAYVAGGIFAIESIILVGFVTSVLTIESFVLTIFVTSILTIESFIFSVFTVVHGGGSSHIACVLANESIRRIG
jgi:hypothetical protein